MKKAEVYLQLQPLIDAPPATPQQLYGQACSNDQATVNSWRKTWISQIKANKQRFGSFAEHGIGQLFRKYLNQPVIVAGAGPSLKGNAEKLKDRGSIPLVSCLHNFHYFEDLGLAPEFYVTLDAGPVTIEEVTEGGTKTAEEYWALTKDRTLLAFTGTHPDLLAKWQGKIYFFNCPIPDKEVEAEVQAIENFNLWVSTGGNVLGACTYIAKGFLGASSVIFVGADFCFSYDHKFHAWDSKYDANLGTCVRLTDIYGIPRLTWQSYANFKGWFDYVAIQVPGHWINASEGGCLGSYQGGNIRAFQYLTLEEVFKMYGMTSHLEAQVKNPEVEAKIILF